jgi:hypothetical protein
LLDDAREIGDRGVVLPRLPRTVADMTEEPNRTRGIQAEMLVGVSAVVIGVCASDGRQLPAYGELVRRIAWVVDGKASG